jgi:hypothetical protein
VFDIHKVDRFFCSLEIIIPRIDPQSYQEILSLVGDFGEITYNFRDSYSWSSLMPNEEVLNAIAGGLAIVISIGGILMMFTDTFTRKKR